MGGLVSFLVEERDGTPDTWHELVGRSLEFIEKAAESGDPRMKELIKVSFVENMHLFGSDCQAVADRLGPASRNLMREYEAKWGSVCRGV